MASRTLLSVAMTGSDIIAALSSHILLTSFVWHLCASVTSPTSSYPLRLPADVIIVSLEPSALSWNFARPKVLPAMDLAVEHLNLEHQGAIRFKLVSREGSCEKGGVGVAAAKISCLYNISVFVGPACSRAVEILAYMVNDWNVPLITPVGNTENIGDKSLFPRLTRINPLMQSSIVDMVFWMLDQYRWESAVFFYDIEDTMGDLFGVTFTKAFQQRSSYTWTGYLLAGKSTTRSVIRTKLMDAATRSRVFLMCLTGSVLRDFFLEAHSLGFSRSGEFVFISMISLATVATDDVTWQLGNGTVEQKVLKDSMAHALFMHIDITELILPNNFSNEMIRRSLVDYGYNYSNDKVSSSAQSCKHSDPNGKPISEQIRTFKDFRNWRF
ncbi:atrial natriuretic peptide receptor 1 [Biomphalaria pfeifferi]|uniref:Atrial natriuretic peptide receptor 1 n=1 Tax=Biomphalaria pfeifferi TaxID=112525 RepID=A0AAD8AYL3_BIOPF|nr:atrial natriuretic peptide receptor 1 [Biomphalaria pfeifferi]